MKFIVKVFSVMVIMPVLCFCVSGCGTDGGSVCDCPVPVRDTHMVNAKVPFADRWDEYENRVWVGQDMWADSLGSWSLNEGELVCRSSADAGQRVVLLAREKHADKTQVVCRVRIDNRAGACKFGAAGFLLGQSVSNISRTEMANQYGGIFAGINPSGKLVIEPLSKKGFLQNVAVTDMEKPNLPDFIDLVLTVVPLGSNYTLMLQSFNADSQGETARISHWNVPGSLVLGHPGLGVFPRESGMEVSAVFDNWQVEGMDMQSPPDAESGYGPIAGAWHTVDHDTLRMTVQLMPVGERCRSVKLQFFDGSDWQTKSVSKVDSKTFMADFSIKDPDLNHNRPYRIEYKELLSSGKTNLYYWSGTVAQAVTGSVVIADSSFVNVAGATAADVLVFNDVKPPADVTADLHGLSAWYCWCFANREIGRDVPCLGIFNKSMTYRNVRIELAQSADPGSIDPDSDWQGWLGAVMKVIWAPDLFRLVKEYTEPDGESDDVVKSGGKDADCGVGYVRADPAKRLAVYGRAALAGGVAKDCSGWPVRCKHNFYYDRNHIGYLAPVEVMGRSNAVVQVINEDSGKLVYSVRSEGSVLLTRIFREGHYTVVVGDPATGTRVHFNNQTQRSPEDVSALRLESSM